ncbi:hypothetical protein BU14_0077s0044 [Porphyra umbilicalis]|uniref:Uncharacterized protein n=1 Tax=Porphyra umbilicalis TaxID=2786 RepID=A0A1X6PEZ2_PORUM|nr:hypothetical protein BU14_0077s0044 [Porphyra umbilicalis]|eukprot:OSX79424.1 hypothetical protein BU14_0077s0044 [Porphyra umbilicalis]
MADMRPALGVRGRPGGAAKRPPARRRGGRVQLLVRSVPLLAAAALAAGMLGWLPGGPPRSRPHDRSAPARRSAAGAAAASRFSTPWLYPAVAGDGAGAGASDGGGRARSLSLNATHHRLLLSSASTASSDDLPGRFLTTNAEWVLATNLLGVTYTHRSAATYGPLTPRGRRRAVEEALGWGDGEVPRQAVWATACARKTVSRPRRGTAATRCGGDATVCTSLVRGGPYAHLVPVDVRAATCAFRAPSAGARGGCVAALRALAAAHPHPWTVFQLTAADCATALQRRTFDGSLRHFHAAYWARRAGWAASPRTAAARRQALRPGFDDAPGHAHVAATVRRLVALLRCAHLPPPGVASCASTPAATAALGRGHLGVRVHVFADGPVDAGALADGWLPAVATATGRRSPVYVDERGTRHGRGYWEGLLLGADADRAGGGAADGRRAGGPAPLDVRLHISTAPLRALHSLAAADIVVCSAAAVCANTVRTVRRGVFVGPALGVPREGEVPLDAVGGGAMTTHHWRAAVRTRPRPVRRGRWGAAGTTPTFPRPAF